MRHRNKVKKFGRNKEHHKALFRNLMTSLVLHEKLQTTESKAKVLKSDFDKLMTKVRRQDDLNKVRVLDQYFTSDIPGKKVLEVLLKRFEGRPSGLTRITKLYNRKGDNAPVVQIELV